MIPPTPVNREAPSHSSRTSADRLRAAAEQRATASYLGELLESPGWREVLAPALAEARELYAEQLIAVTLGFPVMPTPEAEPLPPTVLAARCAAIDWLRTLIETTLQRGGAADARIAAELSRLPSTPASSVI